MKFEAYKRLPALQDVEELQLVVAAAVMKKPILDLPNQGARLVGKRPDGDAIKSILKGVLTQFS